MTPRPRFLATLPGFLLLSGCASTSLSPGDIQGCRRVVLLSFVRAERTEVLLAEGGETLWPLSRAVPDPEKSEELTHLVPPREVCLILEKKIFKRLRASAPFRVFRSLQGPQPAGEIQDYAPLAARGADAVMEVILSGCGTEPGPPPELFLRAEVQLLRLSDYSVLWKKSVRAVRELSATPTLERGERTRLLKAFKALAGEASEKVWSSLEDRFTPSLPLPGDRPRRSFPHPFR